MTIPSGSNRTDVRMVLFHALMIGTHLRAMRISGKEEAAIISAGGEPNFHLTTLMLNRFETLMHKGQLTLEHALDQLVREGYARRVMQMDTKDIQHFIPTTH